jgi:hypothetical protein
VAAAMGQRFTSVATMATGVTTAMAAATTTST